MVVAAQIKGKGSIEGAAFGMWHSILIRLRVTG